ncbi:MAG: glycosyltransferase family 4 protein [Gemmatimonadota bacterium]
MKRVLHFIHTTGPGGAETIFLSLLKGLDGSRWDSVPILTGPGWLEENVRNQGLLPVMIPSSGSFDHRFLRRLRLLIRKQHIDLVHAHLQGAAVYSALAGAVTRVPVLATFHGFPDLELPGGIGSVKSLVLRRLIKRSVFVSGGLRRKGIESRLARPKRAEVIWNGIDLHAFPFRNQSDIRSGERSSRSGETLVGSIGNIRPLKDYPTLLKAAASLTSGGRCRIRFTVYGERTEPLFSQLLGQRDDLGLSESQFSFAGFRDDISTLLPDLDMVVIPSSSEGFSLVAVQAMACGVPVVATRCGGPEEIIEDGVDGLLVPSGDPQALAAAIHRLASDGELQRGIVQAGREKVRARFSLGAMIAAYEEVYRSILGLSLSS